MKRVKAAHQQRARAALRGMGALLMLLGCGGNRAAPPVLVAGAPAAAQPSAPFLLEALLPLRFDEPGVALPDTTLALAAGTSRIIVLRHAAQDLDVFASVTVAASSFAGPGPVTIVIRPIAGVYGIELTADQPIVVPLTLEFRYARHFTPPPGALERYLTPLLYERALAVAQQISATEAVLLPSSRPALDYLAASIPANGRYFAAAPQ